MYRNQFMTNFGAVNISDREMRVLQTAERVWQSRWPKWGIQPPPITDVEQRVLSLAGSIKEACERFAKWQRDHG